jgi:Leucine-rich repeat (LRR) protein/GTPase SAR1 family protein
MPESESLEARIAKARELGGVALSLRDLNLVEVPREIFEFSGLESLNLSANHIAKIPEQIGKLSHLQRLDVTDNPIEEIPDVSGLILDWSTYLTQRAHLSPPNILGIKVRTGETDRQRKPVGEASKLIHYLGAMPNLRELSIGLRSLTLHSPLRLGYPTRKVGELIAGLQELKNLELLHFFGLNLQTVPAGIRQLAHLEHLSLTGTGLKEIPSWICELSDLRVLNLTLNELRRLPGCLAKLDKLEELDLSHNQFSEIPTIVFQMSSLRSLQIRALSDINGFRGRIKEIPTEITYSNIASLEVLDQPIEIPPPEVVQKGIAAVKSYWRQQKEQGVDYLCEAKLILIGEAGSGKTSLARKIQNPAYELQPAESSTEGIEITRWGFASAIHVGQKEPKELIKRDFQVSIWDFGGQEVYHATHQFFLTHRSLYVLVADDRKEDTDFNYWLNIVELLSDNSPVLIVQNEKQDRKRDIDIGTLRARFTDLKETYRVNLANNRGLDGLRLAVTQELQRLPHISELKDFALSGDAIQCRVSRKLVDAAALISDIFPTAKGTLWPELMTAQSPTSDLALVEDASDRIQVFASYSWSNSDVVDQLEKAFAAAGITLVRDKNEVKYKDSISSFMRNVGRGRAVVVVVSKAYLESTNCMFELTEIAEKKEMQGRIFPIILPNTNIFDGVGRLEYVAFWEAKKADLDARMKGVSGENLVGIREELDLFAKIRSTIARIVEILGDMNTLTLEQHKKSEFQELIASLRKHRSDGREVVPAPNQ